jgi:cell division protein FtsL
MNNSIPDLEHSIVKFNDENKDLTVEVVNNSDLISLINIAEKNNKLKKLELNDLEELIDRLRDEIYSLNERL